MIIEFTYGAVAQFARFGPAIPVWTWSVGSLVAGVSPSGITLTGRSEAGVALTGRSQAGVALEGRSQAGVSLTGRV